MLNCQIPYFLFRLLDMFPIDSIHEIQAAVLDLERYLKSRDKIVSQKTRKKYERLVNRFFKEHEKLLSAQQKKVCLEDFRYFLSLTETVIEHYYLEQ